MKMEGSMDTTMNDTVSIKTVFHSEEEKVGHNDMQDKDNVKCLGSDNTLGSVLNLSPSYKNSEIFLDTDTAQQSNITIEKNDIQGDVSDVISPNKGSENNICTNSQICKRILKFIRKENKTVKIWECGICGKEFQHQYTLMRHFPTHTGERKYKCEECGKAFRQKSTLSQHQVIHSEARPYVCGLCKKTFNRASTLKSHHVTHSDKKPHVCPFCNKGFHQKGNLRNHIFVHTEERPYKCNICGKGFNQMSNLMSHKQHSHGNTNPYVCNICHKEFPRKYVLRAHEEYMHGIKYRGGMYVHGVNKMKSIGEFTLNNFTSSDTNQKHQKDDINHMPNLVEGEKALKDTCATSYPDYQSPKLAGEHELRKQSDCPSIIIDPINTKAMLTARCDRRTPIALLKTTLEDSVLVKVVDTENMKQMLVPATAQDLKAAGTITTVKSVDALRSRVGKINAIQIKVPIVATVVQKSSVDGRSSIEVELPVSQQDVTCPEEIMENNGNLYSKFSSESQTSLKYMVRESSDVYRQEVDVLESSNEQIYGASKELHKVGVRASVPEWTSAEHIPYQDDKHSNGGAFETFKQGEFIKRVQQYVKTETAMTNSEVDQYIASDHTVTLLNVKNANSMSNAAHAIEYKMSDNERKCFVNTSKNEMMLVECNPDATLQHILYEQSEESKENIMINPLRYVLNEADNVYIE